MTEEVDSTTQTYTLTREIGVQCDLADTSSPELTDKLNHITELLESNKRSCNRMDGHIDFVESMMSFIRPLGYMGYLGTLAPLKLVKYINYP